MLIGTALGIVGAIFEKKLALIFAGLLVAAAIVVALLPRHEKKEKPREDEQPPEDVTLENLLAIADGKTEVQAQIYVRPWIGKRVRLCARLNDVSALNGDVFMVSLTAPQNELARCYFWAPAPQLNDFSHLQQGNLLTLEGTIETLGWDLLLRDVKLIGVEGLAASTGA